MTEVEQSQEEQADAGPQQPGGAWRWWMAGVLFLATVLTYLDRQTLAICEKMICEEFHLNGEQYGYLVSAFRWAYALVQQDLIPAVAGSGVQAGNQPITIDLSAAAGNGQLTRSADGGASASSLSEYGQLRYTVAVYAASCLSSGTETTDSAPDISVPI